MALGHDRGKGSVRNWGKGKNGLSNIAGNADSSYGPSGQATIDGRLGGKDRFKITEKAYQKKAMLEASAPTRRMQK